MNWVPVRAGLLGLGTGQPKSELVGFACLRVLFFCLFSQACPPAHCLVVAGSFGLGVADRLTSLPCTSATFLTLLVNSNGLYLYLQRRRAGLVSPQ
jgi:hypothetical protein